MASARDQEDGGEPAQTDHWYLVDTHGQKFKLPKTMLFLGREECDVVVASQSVDRRHAVLTFDIYLSQFKVKDLSTTNGTYVNNARIPAEEYITLNHMDSIRLGQDAMMYYIEQSSQTAFNAAGEHPASSYVPSWAINQGLQGEQIKEPKKSMSPTSAGLTHHKEHQIIAQPSQHNQNVSHQVFSHLTSPQLVSHQENHHSLVGHQENHHSLVGHQENHHSQTCLNSDQMSPVLPQADKTNLTHHISIESRLSNISNKSEDSHLTNFSDKCNITSGVSRNTWPRKQQIKLTEFTGSVRNVHSLERAASEVRPAGSSQSLFLVNFEDDVVCTKDIDPQTTDKNQERLPLDKEDTTLSEFLPAKKGTPLYGQPSWWGEHEDDEVATPDNAPDVNKNIRPTKLGLKRSEHIKSSGGPSVSMMEDGSGRPHLSPACMDILLKGEETTKTRDVTTPIKGISSSLSKDSLSASPELFQAAKPGRQLESVSPEVNPATSFTIHLDHGHSLKKPLNIGSSLSEFVPSKIRKNFRERKAMSMSSKGSSKESTPSKNSEERELSPGQQKKVDEQWNLTVDGKIRSWLSGKQTAPVTSLRSPNLENIDILTELNEGRRSLDRDGDKRGPLMRHGSSQSPLAASTKAPSSSSHRPTTKSPMGVTPPFGGSQHTDSSSYLIDKMFEDPSPEFSSQSSKPVAISWKMSKEVANDKSNTSRQSIEKKFVRPVIDSHPSQSIKKTEKFSPAQLMQQTADLENNNDDLQITEDIPPSDYHELDEGEDKEDREDKASEAGTYTIELESEEGQTEEQEARQRIDQVFGVDIDHFNTDTPSIDPLRLASPGGYDNVGEVEDGDRTPLDESIQSPTGCDTDLTVDEECDLSDQKNEGPGSEDIQTWVSQLTALANKKSAETTSRAEPDDGDSSLSKKPPQGINRKRPGTGRKLPSIPSGKNSANSERESHSVELELSDSARSPDLSTSGRSSADSMSRWASIGSSQPTSRVLSNGHSTSPGVSARSVDTELLLQDTQTVMAAMHARLSHKSLQKTRGSYSHDSDSDVSSTVALVNGDSNFVNPSQFKSPREVLAQKQKLESSKKSVNSVPPVTAPVSSVRKPMGRAFTQNVASSKNSSPGHTSSSNIARKSIVSDVISRRDSMDNDSIISDVSSEAGDSHLSRASPRGRGPITKTRTNKTFDLRRARVDSFEEPVISKSAKQAAPAPRPGIGGLVGRSQSLHSTSRNRSITTSNRSEVSSLGAQIVRKSQNNAAQERGRRPSGSQAESSKHNQGHRLQHSTPVTATHPLPDSFGGSRRETNSQQRQTPTNKPAPLSISGVSSTSSRSQSQPGSRSNSPKAAEKMAWKRRKEYDARKSVAAAKASKTPEVSTASVVMRRKPTSGSNLQRRMIRSASYTNTAGLSLGLLTTAGSGSQDFTDGADSVHNIQSFQRAFIPFHNSLRSDRSSFSADEDDGLISSSSTQTYDSLIVASIYQLSLKIKTLTDKTLLRLRDENRVSLTPSPIDDFLSDSGKSEITAWKTANQELAGTLKNLRKLERHVQMMNSVIFPEVEMKSEVLPGVPASRQVKQKLLEDIERKFGFQPISQPFSDERDFASPEMALYSAQF